MRSPAIVDKDEPSASTSRRQESVSRGATRTPIRRRANTDEVKLLMLGYRQELVREFTLFNCFGSSFTALSSLTALGGTYGIGLTYGGPVVMTWGWLVVTFFTTSVGISMAELASAYPTSGALYYWSFKLAPLRLRNLACWMTGWILTMGQAAFAASNVYTFVELLSAAIKVNCDVQLKPGHELLLLLATLAVIGILNCGSAKLTAFMITLGTFWHLIALSAFCVVVPLLASDRQSAKYVYTSWQPHSEHTGISSPVYTVMVGLLMQQWTLTGYDGAAHIAEETHHAEVNVPRAILLTILAVGLTGYGIVLSLLFVPLDFEALTDPANETGGTNVVLQILVEMTKAAYGSVSAGVALFTIPIVGNFFCSYQSIANNSRMLYAFARDNGVPLARFAKRVHPGTKAPVFGVAYMLFLTGILATPMCFNAFVFPAVTSFAVVGCYLAYSLPVLCKVATGRRYFLAGPFHLGPRLSYANNVVSLLWVGAVTVLFTLPQFYPIKLINVNWSAPILGVAIIFALGWYHFPKYGAKIWFKGPRANLGQFNDVLPSELARVVSQDVAAAAAAAAAAATAASRLSLVQEEPEVEQLDRCTGGEEAKSRTTTVVGYPAASHSGTPERRSGSNSTYIRRISRHSTNKTLRASPSVAACELLMGPEVAEADGGGGGGGSGPITGGHSSQGNALHSGSLGNRGRSAIGIGASWLASPSHRCIPLSPTAVSRARRQSALSLLDGPLSCGSHIVHLLQDTGLADESGLQAIAGVYGGGGGGGGGGDGSDVRSSSMAAAAAATAAAMLAADGRPTREPGGDGRRTSFVSVRNSQSGRHDNSWPIWATWMGGGGGGGGGGGASGPILGVREHPSAPGGDRTTTPSWRNRAAVAGDDAIGPPLLALGGGQRGHYQRHPYHFLHQHHYQLLNSADCLSLTHTSESGAQTGSTTRPRARRATVSVVALTSDGSGGGGGGGGNVDGGGAGRVPVSLSGATSGAAVASQRSYVYRRGGGGGGHGQQGIQTHLLQGKRMRAASAECVMMNISQPPPPSSSSPTVVAAVTDVTSAPDVGCSGNGKCAAAAQGECLRHSSAGEAANDTGRRQEA